MSEALALHYAAEALRCVGALHACAMLHCDLKPDNFLLSAHGRLQLIDFGRAVDLALLPAGVQLLVCALRGLPRECCATACIHQTPAFAAPDSNPSQASRRL